MRLKGDVVASMGSGSVERDVGVGSRFSSRARRCRWFIQSGCGDTIEVGVMVAWSGTMGGAIIDIGGGPTVALSVGEDKVEDEAEKVDDMVRLGGGSRSHWGIVGSAAGMAR